MYKYLFNYNKINNIENITVFYYSPEEDKLITENIGTIYNVIDFIRYDIKNDSTITLAGFKGNQVEEILSYITHEKTISQIEGYNSFTVKNKKKKR